MRVARGRSNNIAIRAPSQRRVFVEKKKAQTKCLNQMLNKMPKRNAPQNAWRTPIFRPNLDFHQKTSVISIRIQSPYFVERFCRRISSNILSGILSKDWTHFVEGFCRRILSKDFVEGFCRNLGGILSKDCLEHFVGDGVVHLKNVFVLKFVLFWSFVVFRPNTGVTFVDVRCSPGEFFTL